MLIIISGPSGVGKSRLIDVAQSAFGFGRVVPVTTREPREGETPGVDYEFITKAEFQGLVQADALCGWDYALRNYYGYRRNLENRLRAGDNIAVHALARLGIRMSKSLLDTLLVFLEPGSEVLLQGRLEKRKTERVDGFLRRLHWEEEREHAPMFDIIVKNADITPSEELTQIIADVLERFA